SRDLLLVCKECHSAYEQAATVFKKAIAERFGIPLEGRGWVRDAEKGSVQRAASAILRNRKRRRLGVGGSAGIPEERVNALEDVVSQWWTREHGGDMERLTDGMLQQACSLSELSKSVDFISHGEYVVQQLMAEKSGERWPQLEAFVEEWRAHFIAHTGGTPFLSSRWCISGRVYNNNALNYYST
ncbi:hypothetical protein BC938DRAFT_473061, partial [Jimgerdemannia flammicorona]